MNAFLREALLSPSAALPEGFLMVEAVPRQGAKVTGIRVGEDPLGMADARHGRCQGPMVPGIVWESGRRKRQHRPKLPEGARQPKGH